MDLNCKNCDSTVQRATRCGTRGWVGGNKVDSRLSLYVQYSKRFHKACFLPQTPGGVQQARRRRRSRRPAAKPKAYKGGRTTRDVFRAGRSDRTWTTKPGTSPVRAVQARLPKTCSARPVQGLALPTNHAKGKAAPVQGAALHAFLLGLCWGYR